MRWADWLLLSQGLSLEEAVPGRVPFICGGRGVRREARARARDLSPRECGSEPWALGLNAA